MYLTPVMFSEAIAPPKWRWLFHVNPMLGIVEGFRWSLIANARPPQLADIAFSVIFALVALSLGAMMFTRLENFAVDRI
jgi:lipopolysaccharide transport system permease protein